MVHRERGGGRGLRLSLKIVSERKRQKARLRRSSQESRRKHSRMLNQGCQENEECRERGNLHGGSVVCEIPRRLYELRNKSKDVSVSWETCQSPLSHTQGEHTALGPLDPWTPDHADLGGPRACTIALPSSVGESI